MFHSNRNLRERFHNLKENRLYLPNMKLNKKKIFILQFLSQTVTPVFPELPRTEFAVTVDKNINVQQMNNIWNPNNNKKLLVCGDSHVKRLSKRLLNNSLKKSHAVLKNFDGANIKRLSHHILPYLHEDKPDSVILHMETMSNLIRILHRGSYPMR